MMKRKTIKGKPMNWEPVIHTRFDETSAEEQAAFLNKALPSLSELRLEKTTQVSDGCQNWIYKVDGEHVSVIHEQPYADSPVALERTDCKFSRSQLLQTLFDLHMEQWGIEYDDDSVTEGVFWDLYFKFQGCDTELHYHGHNAYPDNFKTLTNLLGVTEELMEN